MEGAVVNNDRFHLEEWFSELKQKWILIAQVYILNTIIVPMIILTICTFYYPILGDLKEYAEVRQNFFVPMSNFITFFKKDALYRALSEEFNYRIYAWLLVNIINLWTLIKFRLNIFQPKNYRYDWSWLALQIFVWNVALISNTAWTKIHFPEFNYVMIPIFIAGMSWNFLVIKTGKIWPAVTSHILANTSIFFFIKIIQSLGIQLS